MSLGPSEIISSYWGIRLQRYMLLILRYKKIAIIYLLVNYLSYDKKYHWKYNFVPYLKSIKYSIKNLTIQYFMTFYYINNKFIT